MSLFHSFIAASKAYEYDVLPILGFSLLNV